MKINGKTVQVFRFRSLANAKSFALNTAGSPVIVLGENEEYWVCSGRAAGILRRAGFEVVLPWD